MKGQWSHICCFLAPLPHSLKQNETVCLQRKMRESTAAQNQRVATSAPSKLINIISHNCNLCVLSGGLRPSRPAWHTTTYVSSFVSQERISTLPILNPVRIGFDSASKPKSRRLTTRYEANLCRKYVFKHSKILIYIVLTALEFWYTQTLARLQRHLF